MNLERKPFFNSFDVVYIRGSACGNNKKTRKLTTPQSSQLQSSLQTHKAKFYNALPGTEEVDEDTFNLNKFLKTSQVLIVYTVADFLNWRVERFWYDWYLNVYISMLYFDTNSNPGDFL